MNKTLNEKELDIINIKDNVNDKLANKLLKENEYSELESFVLSKRTIIKAMNHINSQVESKQDKIDSRLKTKSKDIVEAINEIYDKVNEVVFNG